MPEALLSNGTTNGHKHDPATVVSGRPHVLDSLFPSNVLLEVPAKGVGATRSNLIETWDAYVVQMTLPGADPASVDIAMTARRLTIKGTYRVPAIEAGSYVWHDIPGGRFTDMVEIPGEVDADKARAFYDRGILTVELPKVAHLKPKSIQLETPR